MLGMQTKDCGKSPRFLNAFKSSTGRLNDCSWSSTALKMSNRCPCTPVSALTAFDLGCGFSWAKTLKQARDWESIHFRSIADSHKTSLLSKKFGCAGF